MTNFVIRLSLFMSNTLSLSPTDQPTTQLPTDSQLKLPAAHTPLLQLRRMSHFDSHPAMMMTGMALLVHWHAFPGMA